MHKVLPKLVVDVDKLALTGEKAVDLAETDGPIYWGKTANDG